jgi:hypothetical protein
MEFEDTILEDLHSINIHGDMKTHTSDHFDRIYELAIKLIKEGNAYTDNTEQTKVTCDSPLDLSVVNHLHRCVRKDGTVLLPHTETTASKRISRISPR